MRVAVRASVEGDHAAALDGRKFRKVEIRDRQLLVNGQPILIHGMNRHDHSDEYGKAVTKELMELDAGTLVSVDIAPGALATIV